ncbi:MAG: gliding motility-associated C-terminal domain-containing protein [Bacteroidia bacterium]
MAHLFSAAQDYFANGTAQYQGGDCYQLTSAVNWENGSVWYTDKIDLKKDFDLEFYMNFGNMDGGADGIVFVLQNKGNKALGLSGGGLGYEGFSPSLGIEFDDFQNGSFWDPVQDHIGVLKNGNISHNSANSLHKPVAAIVGGGNIEDGQNHLVRVTWDAQNTLLEVYFDCEKRISLTYDIDQNIFGGKRWVYWGFTAATGGLNNKQTVCLRKDIISKDTVPICKGDAVLLNSRKSVDNNYRWWPSIDLNDSSIKRTICTSIVPRTYYVEFTNLCLEKVIDTVEVVIHTPFTMDETQDSLLCDGEIYRVDLESKYDSIRWNDGVWSTNRLIRYANYYKFRAWQGVCWDDDSMTVTVDTTPNLKIVGDSFFCEGGNTTLKVISSPKSAIFNWHDGTTDSSIQFFTTTSTSVRALNQCGEAEAFYKVREIIMPELEVVGDTIYCPGEDVIVSAIKSNNLKVYWNDGTTGLTTSGDSGWYVARVNDQSCMARDSLWVAFRPNPIADVPSIPLLCDYEPLFLFHEQALSTPLWSLGHSSLTADYSLESGAHWLKVSNECGMDSLGFVVERKECVCDLAIPNAFSPNQDEINDIFHAVSLCDKLLTFEISIYNMWGERMFTSNSIEQGWDGSFKGSPVQNGTYPYTITYTGIEGKSSITRAQKGIIHLIR